MPLAVPELRMNLPAEITWQWLEPRLKALKASWIEKHAGLRKDYLCDVKRGKAHLSEEDLARIRGALEALF